LGSTDGEQEITESFLTFLESALKSYASATDARFTKGSEDFDGLVHILQFWQGGV